MEEALLSRIGTGIAKAGFPAKFTAAVFCRPKTCASKRAEPQKREILGLIPLVLKALVQSNHLELAL
jgi:hypothetical protein